jgi:uncharacterized protein with HEPN domain
MRGRQEPATVASDQLLRLAVERSLEIISEASRHIPDELKAQETRIAWHRMADLGNWLRHAYHRVDADLLWNIAKNDLAPLKSFIQRVASNSKRQ